MLEVIDTGPGSDPATPPLLFVHGAWHGAWCWERYFLGFFADQGYRCVAVSLRGHGNSPAPRRMQFCSMVDLVDDVASVAGACLLYTSPSPRDRTRSRMPSSA